MQKTLKQVTLLTDTAPDPTTATPDQEIPTSEGQALPGQSTITTVGSTTATTAAPPAGTSFPLGAIVGAIIGVIAAVIILVVIIVVCVLARRQCSRKSKKTVSPADANRRSYQNGIYYGAGIII